MDGGNELERLMSYMGPVGRYQIRQYILLCMVSLNAGIHMLSLLTVAAVPKHRCLLPGEDSSPDPPSYNSSIAWSTFNSTADNEWPSCWYPSENDTQTQCTSFVYDDTYYKSSRAIEMNMVCGRRWMKALAQSGYMLGLVLGSVTLGRQADKYGRKPVLVASAVLQLIFTISVAFVNDFYSFVILRFLSGMGTAGSLAAAFVLIMEFLDLKYRTAFSMAFQAFFSVGIGILAVCGYFIRDRKILQLVYGAFNLLLIGHWWLIDESPRWLWSEGRTEEAVAIVTRASVTNYGHKHKQSLATFARKDAVHAAVKRENSEKQVGTKEGKLSDLFRMPNLRKRTLNMALNWFANSLVYYGLSMNTGTMEGNPYLILFLVGMVEIPGYAVSAWAMNRVGRRSLVSSYMILGGIACIVATFMPTKTTIGSAFETIIVVLGKFFIAGSFAIIYIYTTEMFPTVVRNTALGITSMCARISGAVTPFISLLDSFDKTLPSLVFAVVVIVSGFLTLFLPETLGRPLPQSVADGERFGEDDTFSLSNLCCRREDKKRLQPPSMIRVPTVIINDEHVVLNEGENGTITFETPTT